MLHFPSPDIGMFGRRLRHARGHRIPVTITRDGVPREHDTAVLTDTFGPHDVMLPGGCRCCTVRMELQNALRRLLAEHAHRPFTRVIIETGEDLGPVLRTFATTRALGAEFYVEEHPVESVHGVSSFVLTEGAPLSWDAFSRFITTLMALRGTDLLRAKGLLNVTGCSGPVVVEFLQHLALPPVELQAWPGGDREGRLEFVTRNVEEQAVRHLFSAVRTLSTSL